MSMPRLADRNCAKPHGLREHSDNGRPLTGRTHRWIEERRAKEARQPHVLAHPNNPGSCLALISLVVGDDELGVIVACLSLVITAPVGSMPASFGTLSVISVSSQKMYERGSS